MIMFWFNNANNFLKAIIVTLLSTHQPFTIQQLPIGGGKG